MKTREAVEAFVEECRYRSLSPKTVQAYLWALDKLERAHPKDLPTEPRAIKRLIGESDLSPESRFGLWRRLRTFWRWLHREYGLEDLMARVPAPRRRLPPPRTLTEGEVERLLATAPCRRDRALLALLVDTGIRIGEAASLRWEHVGQDSIQVSGKTGIRRVPLSPRVRRLLVGLGDGEHLWEGRQGPLTYSGLVQVVRRAMQRAGILGPKVGPHTLRHTFGRLYILAGGDPYSLQRILGHRSPEMTRRYVELDDRDVRRQHARFSPLRRLRVVGD